MKTEHIEIAGTKMLLVTKTDEEAANEVINRLLHDAIVVLCTSPMWESEMYDGDRRLDNPDMFYGTPEQILDKVLDNPDCDEGELLVRVKDVMKALLCFRKTRRKHKPEQKDN